MRLGLGISGSLAALAVSVLAFFQASACAAAMPQEHELQVALAQLAANYTQVQQRMGSPAALDLQERLNTDLGEVVDDSTPEGYPAAAWRERVGNQADLDASIVEQAIAGTSRPIAGSQALVERLILTSDGTLQPFALYVPESAFNERTTTLVVLLHGRPQTESALLSAPYFRRLAEVSGTIIAAPWGRGIYDFAPPGDDEVYRVAREVAAAFHILPGHVYLAGYSMGRFSVFQVAPAHPEQWAAIMSIAGSLLGSRAAAFSQAFPRTRMYVITGTLDDSIPTQYPQSTALYLASKGIPTGLYVEPRGNHGVFTLMPSLTRAWNDMLAGRVGGVNPGGGLSLPEIAPPPVRSIPAT